MITTWPASTPNIGSIAFSCSWVCVQTHRQESPPGYCGVQHLERGPRGQESVREAGVSSAYLRIGTWNCGGLSNVTVRLFKNLQFDILALRELHEVEKLEETEAIATLLSSLWVHRRTNKQQQIYCIAEIIIQHLFLKVPRNFFHFNKAHSAMYRHGRREPETQHIRRE